ncbi:MAG: tRNA (guanine37-N1)-methyltransferase [Kiritimatiellia bacterium]|jgi:tRNA (guanine37-N1)-methyltransferase
MKPPLRIDILTLFPEMLEGILGASMMARASKLNAVCFNLVDPRAFATDVHHSADDRPYGGGPGMVMKPEPLAAAIESVKTEHSRVIYLSPQGTPFTQGIAERLTGESHLILICGHYEGIDERIVDLYVDEEISIGDYVLTNGVLPAAVVADAVVRLLPGVVGGEGGTEAESFSTGMLDFPHYTRPEEFKGIKVPQILLSGDHAKIAAWRKEQARARTLERRPDLLDS